MMSPKNVTSMWGAVVWKTINMAIICTPWASHPIPPVAMRTYRSMCMKGVCVRTHVHGHLWVFMGVHVVYFQPCVGKGTCIVCKCVRYTGTWDMHMDVHICVDYICRSKWVCMSGSRRVHIRLWAHPTEPWHQRPSSQGLAGSLLQLHSRRAPDPSSVSRYTILSWKEKLLKC